jgi:uncharacterized membrane protein
VRETPTLHAQPGTETSEVPHSTTGGRLVALVGGAALITLAARDRSWRRAGLALAGAPLVWRGATGSWPIHRTATDSAEAVPAPIEVNVTIDRPRQELWQFWRRIENLPQFMRHLERVEDHGNGRSHWYAKSPVGIHVDWEAEIVDEREGHFLSWSSLPDSRVHNAGSVFFEDDPAGRGTIVRVQMEATPGHGLGRAVGRVLSPVTERQVHEDLRRFKSLMEAGEIPTTDGQPAGRRSALNPHNPF